MGRSSDRDEQHPAVGYTRKSILAEAQMTGRDVACNHLLEAWLIDGYSALIECIDPGAVDVDAENLVTHLRKTASRHKPYVSGAEQGDLQGATPTLR